MLKNKTLHHHLREETVTLPECFWVPDLSFSPLEKVHLGVDFLTCMDYTIWHNVVCHLVSCHFKSKHMITLGRGLTSYVHGMPQAASR